MANAPQPGKSTFKGATKMPAFKAPAAAASLAMNRKAVAVRHAVSPMSAAQKARSAKILKALGN